MYLVRSIHQPLGANARVPSRQRCIVTVAQRAMQLQGGIYHLMYHVREKHLGNSVFLSEVHTPLGFISDVHQHQARLVDFSGAIRQHPAHSLPVRQALAEGGAIRNVLRCQIQSTLCHCHVMHAMTQATIGQAVLTHIEALSTSTQNVVSGNPQILDLDFRVRPAQFEPQFGMRLHGLDVALSVAELDDTGDGWDTVGYMHYMLADYEDSVEAFEKAVDKGNLSDRASTLLFLSRALYELDEFEAARSAARQAADAADSDSSRNAASNYLTLIDSTEQRYNIIEQRKADAIDFYEPYPSLID